MKLGIATPVVTNVAGSALTWEQDATIEDIGRVAETADRLGYHHMTCSEHIGLPSTETDRRGARYWDPLSTFGYVSARTRQIKFATMTLVLGYHHPLAIVKRYGTLDHVSNGRVILGLGVGSLKEEFDLLGAPFDDRGARGDDHLRALRAALASNQPTYDGEFYSFGGLTVDPCALQPHLPFWIGGRTKRSLRRAVTLAEGWCPFYVSIETAAQWLETFDVPSGFEVVMPAEQPLDPVGEPQATADTLGRMAAGGTTTLSARFVHHSLEHYLEQLHALVELPGAELTHQSTSVGGVK
ncbi:MAG: TIGR03619 family F420-dependent LLM class oxidoreductase [Mycobacterium sp.]